MWPGGRPRDLGLPGLVGPFLFGLVGILAAGVVVAVFLRPDPLLVAREAAVARGAGVVRTSTSWARVRAVVRERPGVRAGVAALALAHAVMISVMVMTPLHMHHGGATLEVIGIVISVHVLGMFALAPLVGWAADRFGRPPVLTAGAGVLFLALLLAGTSPRVPRGRSAPACSCSGWAGRCARSRPRRCCRSRRRSTRAPTSRAPPTW